MDFMVNCALDSKLAKQIFLAVSSASLETMVVRSGGLITTSRHADGIVSTGQGTGRALGWGSMQFGMEHYIAGLQRQWVVEKYFADWKKEKLGIIEIRILDDRKLHLDSDY